jgi:hypothetical protein
MFLAWRVLCYIKHNYYIISDFVPLLRFLRRRFRNCMYFCHSSVNSAEPFENRVVAATGLSKGTTWVGNKSVEVWLRTLFWGTHLFMDFCTWWQQLTETRLLFQTLCSKKLKKLDIVYKNGGVMFDLKASTFKVVGLLGYDALLCCVGTEQTVWA